MTGRWGCRADQGRKARKALRPQPRRTPKSDPPAEEATR